jgi:Na+/melibiose symporter-like transporter
MYSLATFLASTIMGSFLYIFITEKLLIGAVVMGTILMVGRIVDLLVCTVAGGIIQKVNMRWGRYRSWTIILKYVIFGGYVTLFFNTNAFPFPVKVLFIMVGYLAINAALNFAATSSFGILASIAGPSLENRNKMSIWNTRFMVIGQLIASSCGLPLVNKMTPILGEVTAYSFVMTLVGFIYFLGIKSLSDVAKPYDLPIPTQQSGGPARPQASLGDMLKAVVTNDQLLIFMFTQLCSYTAVFGVLATLRSYYFMYILGNFNLLTPVMSAQAIIGLVCITIGPKVGVKLGKKRALVVGMSFYALSGVLIFLFGATSVYAYVGLVTIGTMGNYFWVGFGANYTIDCGEYGYWKSGKDNRTVVMSMFNVPMKMAVLLGGTVGAFVLAFIGYTPGFNPAEVPNFNRNFMFMFGCVPGILNAIGALVFGLAYKITDVDAAKYAKENAEKVRQQAVAS